jgi:quinol monooxygenase YgiN
MSVEVVAEIQLVAGSEEEALAALRELIEVTHAKDDGCLLYALHRDLAEPTRLVFVEKWESPEALAAHGQSDHIAALRSAPGIAAPPRVLVLESLGYGDADKGTL